MRSKDEFLAFHRQWLFASTFPNVIYKLLLRIALDILLISKKRAKLCWVEKLLLTCQTFLKYFNCAQPEFRTPVKSVDATTPLCRLYLLAS